MPFLKASIDSLVVRVVLLFVSMASGIINARWLGPEGVGLYALMVLIPSFCFRFGSFGIGSSLSYFTAKKLEANSKILRVAWIFGLGVSALCILLILLIDDAPLAPWSGMDIHYLVYALAGIPIFFMRNFYQRIASGMLKIQAVNISDVLASVIYVVLIVILVIGLDRGVEGSLLAWIVSQLVALIFLAIFLRKASNQDWCEFPELNTGSIWSRMFAYGGWNYVVLLCVFMVDSLPILILKQHATFQVLGLFAVANALRSKINIIPNSLSMVLFPYTAASEDAQAINRTNTMCRSFVLIMFSIIAGLVLVIQDVILVLYGDEFLESADIFVVLLPSIFVFPFYKFLSVHIMAVGSSRLNAYRQFVMLVILIALSFSIIPAYGPIGAAFCLSLTYVAGTILTIILYMRMTKSSLHELLVPSKNDFKIYFRLFRQACAKRS